MKIILNHEADDKKAAAGEAPAKKIERKWMLLGAALLAVAILLAVNHQREAKLPTGSISFKGANVVLLPGPGWITLFAGGFTRVKDICLPVLQGVGRFDGCMIEVTAPAKASSDPTVWAKELATALSHDPGVVSNSVSADPFVTASGLAGIRVGAHIKVRDLNREGESVACAYFVANAQGRCIRINFTCKANPDGAAADEMIRRTLALR